jgi:ABC-2 type transport system permease protein
LGFALSSVTASADGAVVAVHAIYMPMLFLCGAFIPVEAMPKALQVVAHAIPLTYFVGPFRGVMVEGAGLGVSWVIC